MLHFNIPPPTGKATFVLPSDLGYGDAGSGDVIPPGSTLQFEVELFTVKTTETLDDDFETLTLPDGTTIRVPKGVKARVIEDEEEEEGASTSDE